MTNLTGSFGFAERWVEFCGAAAIDLLLYVAMISSLFMIGILWHVVQTLPGLLESVGYLYGILVASFTLDLYLRRDLD